MAKQRNEFWKGFWDENPTFRLMLGLCPTLAVTTSLVNGLGMGLATLAVLLGSNIAISLVRDSIPSQIRIPSFIVIIASFVTIIDLSMHAFAPVLHAALGIFVPLIVVNCIILGRAEAFASKNSVWMSVLDAIGMGLGFTVNLMVLGGLREIVGSGQLLGRPILPAGYQPSLVMILPPGAFLTLGMLMALMNLISRRLEVRRAAGRKELT
ncbi:MAG: electron transport complex subunit E [Candidatus Abyssobacteria bacterium SURF_17]|jgi:electron transport complex protein RnfE|uniref:Ion-translocating oxidoreductase complex subunit E n=1 Tax=Candidatus Abyssobacteria bacterium SURF_17 TaxID=2093361 RepID=A0A419F1I6_9BACT|nr:MAG: electron transport complex subunit E [Candidatus Abyssubacteria bacterium SURF_17]